MSRTAVPLAMYSLLSMVRAALRLRCTMIGAPISAMFATQLLWQFKVVEERKLCIMNHATALLSIAAVATSRSLPTASPTGTAFIDPPCGVGLCSAGVAGAISMSCVSPIWLGLLWCATDESMAYKRLHFRYPQHQSVNHHAKQYVIGAVHTNTIEGFWSIFKRGIVGSFHKVSRKYMSLYVAEFQFRYNNRFNDDIFGTAIAGA